MLPATTAEGDAALRPVPGGAVMNTAVGLGRLDLSTALLSGVSTDQFGKVIESHIAESKVNAEALVKSDRPTTLAFVSTENGVVSYDFYDENTAGRMIETEQLPDLSEQTHLLFFGGISLISEPASDSYAQFLTDNAGDRVVMMDPNIRPAFIKKEQAYRARLATMLAKTHVVKTSDEDLEWLFPDAANAQGAIQQLMDMGPNLVLFTEGSKGATACRKGREPLFVPSEKVTVVDTVGAGDTFNAGFLAALHDQDITTANAVLNMDDDQLTKAIAFAAKCAAVSVSRAGAQPPWRHEVGNV
jgi:fructokinase